jgi:uncharacterized membrane protein (UPF0127 family)
MLSMLLRTALTLLPLLVPGAHAADATPNAGLPVHSFQVCGRKVRLEIASTYQSRAIGLMHRSSVPEGTGMLFFYPVEDRLRFWMKNVPMDIDIGFFDAQGSLVGWHTMKGTQTRPASRPKPYPIYESQGPAQFAVELTAGFFKSSEKTGCRLQPVPDARKLRIEIEP